jgi:hypothetical protein
MYMGELSVLKIVAMLWILLITSSKSARVRSFSATAARPAGRVVIEEGNMRVLRLSTMNAGSTVSKHLHE